MSVLFSLSVPSSLSSRSSRRRVTSGLLPPFLRLVIPNPQPAPAKASTLVELMYAHGKRWELKKERAGEVDTHGAHSIHASGVGAHLRRHLAVQDKGRAVLAALQQELYEQGEQVRVLVVRRAHGQRLRQFALLPTRVGVLSPLRRHSHRAAKCGARARTSTHCVVRASRTSRHLALRCPLSLALTPSSPYALSVLLNESHHDVTIDVPLPLQDGDAEAYARTDVTLRRLDTAVQAALRNHAS